MSRVDTVGATEKPGFFLEIPRLESSGCRCLTPNLSSGRTRVLQTCMVSFFMHFLDQSFLGFFLPASWAVSFTLCSSAFTGPRVFPLHRPDFMLAGLAHPFSAWNPELSCMGGDKGINTSFYTNCKTWGAACIFFYSATNNVFLYQLFTGSVLLMWGEYGTFHCLPDNL